MFTIATSPQTITVAMDTNRCIEELHKFELHVQLVVVIPSISVSEQSLLAFNDEQLLDTTKIKKKIVKTCFTIDLKV